MSSRPNSSRNHPKSMYSSLPSASKIYVSTTKPKQKNIHSAKRKRKKSEHENSIVESIASDETLISLTTPIISSSQLGLKAIDSPQNITNKFSNSLSKEEWVEKIAQFDESDSDSYTHDDKVRVVNTYFDVCIESDEDHGAPFHEPKELSKKSNDDNKIDDPIDDESTQINTPSLTHKSDPENYLITEELSKSVENIVIEKPAIETNVKNILNDSNSACLIQTVNDNGQKSISKESNSIILNNKCSEEDGLTVRDDVLERNGSQIDPNISQISDCKNVNSDSCNNLKKEKSLIVENDEKKSHSHDEKPENIVELDEKLIDPHIPKVPYKTESAMNATMTFPSNLDTDEIMTCSLDRDETMLLNECLEQDSCTESELIDLNNISDHCSNDETKGESKDKYLESNTIIELFPMKRSISLPEGLQALREHFHAGSNITSDKATITSDLFTVDSVKPMKCLKEDHTFRGSSTVASGEDVPIVDILPTLTMLKAKMRSYVFGCKGLDGALLGSEELSRFFPNYKIAVFVGTWNMNGQDPPKNIDDFLLPHDSETLPDIYAIGVQESMQSKSEWELLLQTTLGPSHVLFASTSLGVLHLAIFLRRDLIWFCSEPEDANIATRVGSMVKTKGAVAICFMLFGTSFLFVNSHLTVDRISDYEKICAGLDLPKNIPSKISHQNKNVTSRFDCVFWCGDLNFRIMWNRLAVLRFMKERDHSNNESCSTLLKHDQLQKAIKEGAAFHGFQEGFINFDPSFKFDVGTNAFDSTKQRVPSYTDRVLYRFKESSCISCLHYNSVPELVSSDHKPVYGIFNVTLKPGRDDVPLAAGIFKRDVYLEALKRRANFLEVSRDHKQSAVCSMM
nr:uncharacterized protein LOC107443026 isoform X2 [Parasteatoda tepidariorum]